MTVSAGERKSQGAVTPRLISFIKSGSLGLRSHSLHLQVRELAPFSSLLPSIVIF